MWSGFENIPNIHGNSRNIGSSGSSRNNRNNQNATFVANNAGMNSARSNRGNGNYDTSVTTRETVMPMWGWLASALGGISALLIVILVVAWYRGAFDPVSWFHRSQSESQTQSQSESQSKPEVPWLWWPQSKASVSADTLPVAQRSVSSWCFVGTDNSNRVCIAVPNPSLCGDITAYTNESDCKSGQSTSLPIITANPGALPSMTE